MTKLLLLALATVTLAACTTRIVGSATDNGFATQEFPEIQFNFEGFTYIEAGAPFYYAWKSKNNTPKKLIVIKPQRIPNGSYRVRQTQAGYENYSLLAGKSTINGQTYETRILCDVEDMQIYKRYTTYVGTGNLITLAYFEQLTDQEAHAYNTWQKEKYDLLQRGDSAVGDKLIKKRKEPLFTTILEFEKRADAIFKVTSTEQFVPNGTYY